MFEMQDATRRESQAIRVVLIEDNAVDAERVKKALQEAPECYQVKHIAVLSELPITAEQSDVDVILLALSQPDSHGLETLRKASLRVPDLPIVVLASLDQDKMALAALREGAQEYCVKSGIDQEPLLRVIRRAIERKRFENFKHRIDRSDRLAAIGQLAAGVAHEISNPAAFLLCNLNVMKEFSADLEELFSTLRSSSSGFSPENQKIVDNLLKDREVDSMMHEMNSMLDDNLSGMERIRSITNELRSFSRIERDDAEWVQLNDVVTSACNMVGNEIRHRAVLTKELGELPPIAAHRGKLAQAILGVLMNAVQSIEEGAVGSNRITVRTRHANAQVIVSVEDTGCGIDPDEKDRIFEPYFTTKPREVGTGLGLTLCAETIRKHGGEVEVHSVVGEGSCFRLILPRDTGLPVASAMRGQEVVVEPRPARLLLVDDDVRVRRGLRRMLQSTHEVLEAEGGNEALAILERDDSFDVILCDLMMPDGDGRMLYEALCKVAPDLCSRMVFLSGGAFTPRASEFTARPGIQVLDKPVFKEDLFATIDRVANERWKLQDSVPQST